MYINPFLAGVLATIGAELAAMLIWAIVLTVGRTKKHGN